MRENRGSWYLFTGVIVGIALGLVYSWVINPIEYVDAAPSSLREDFKEQYRALVAAAYMSSGNLARAEARLELLSDTDIARTLAIQAQRALTEGRPEYEARALGLIAVALGQAPTTLETSLPTPFADTPSLEPSVTLPPTSLVAESETPNSPTGDTQEPTSTQHTPNATSTPLPTRTPTVTPGAPFELQEISLICNPGIEDSLILVDVRDAADDGVPGIEVIVHWDEGEDHFFTGMKPELGLGYADFTMTPGVTYLLQLAEGGAVCS